MTPPLQDGMDGDDSEARAQREAAMQRVRIGITGLAAVFLLTLLAASVFSFLGDDQHGTRLANGVVVATGAVVNGEEPPREPLAELGVAPGGATPKAPAPAHPAPAGMASAPPSIRR